MMVLVLRPIDHANAYDYEIIRLTENNYEDMHPQINSKGQVVWFAYIGNYPKAFFYDGTRTIELTMCGYYDMVPRINNRGQVVWQGWDSNDWELFLYDGTNIIQLTDNSLDDYGPQINDSGQVVWVAGGYYNQVFFYDGEGITQLTNDNSFKRYHQINNLGQVVWQGWGGTDYKLYLYDGSSTIKLLANGVNDYHKINDLGQVVWVGLYGQIFLYDRGEIKQLSNTSAYLYSSPQINASGQVVWDGWDLVDHEIFLYDGTSTIKLTNNTFDDFSPQINDLGQVVWVGGVYNDHQVFLYDGTTTHRLTNDTSYKGSPQINILGQVVWTGRGGTVGTYDEIFFATPIYDSDGDGIPDNLDKCPNENSIGFDVDGDGCIDSTSGLGTIIGTLVQEGVIAPELQTSLLAKVDNAEKSATKDNICAAINQLNALKNQVNAQRGNKISNEAADAIIAYTDSVINYLRSQLPPGESC